MVALMRRSAGDSLAMIGVSSPPYKEWQWTKTRYFIGGPNFMVLPGGQMIGGGRFYVDGDSSKPKTALANMTLTSYEPALTLPSGGDSSYPGFAWHKDLLWTMYYSSHEGRTSIYLAKVRLR
jgi:hypothetical protein